MSIIQFDNESLIFLPRDTILYTIFQIDEHFFLFECELAKGSVGQQDEHKMKPYFQRVGRRVRHDLPYKYMILLCFYFFFFG